MTAVPSNSPNSLCGLGLVSTGLSGITGGSHWDSGLVLAGPASACWSWSSVRWQVLVTLLRRGAQKFQVCSLVPGGVPAAEPAQLRYWCGGLQLTAEVRLWKSCCGMTVSESILGSALPILSKRGREGGRAGGGEGGGGEERKREARMWGGGGRKHVRRGGAETLGPKAEVGQTQMQGRFRLPWLRKGCVSQHATGTR